MTRPKARKRKATFECCSKVNISEDSMCNCSECKARGALTEEGEMTAEREAWPYTICINALRTGDYDVKETPSGDDIADAVERQVAALKARVAELEAENARLAVLGELVREGQERGDYDSQQPSAGSDEEWAKIHASWQMYSTMDREAVKLKELDRTRLRELELVTLAGLAEGRRKEREDGVAQRLASDALATISGLRGSTPAEGYLKAPFLLSSDIERLVAEREQAAAREMAELVVNLRVGDVNPGAGDQPLILYAPVETWMKIWKEQRGKK